MSEDKAKDQSVESTLANDALSGMPSPDPGGTARLGLLTRVGSAWVIDGVPARDKLGGTFDPTIHVTDEDGTPKLTKRRLLVRKPGARSRKGMAPPPSPERQPVSIPPGGAPGQEGGAVPPVQPVSDYEAQYRTLAVMTTVMLENAARMGGGDAWKMKTRDPNEREMIENAWYEYFKARDMRNVPPEVALFGAIAMWAGPRIDWSAVRERVRTWGERWGWVAKRDIPVET